MKVYPSAFGVSFGLLTRMHMSILDMSDGDNGKF